MSSKANGTYQPLEFGINPVTMGAVVAQPSFTNIGSFGADNPFAGAQNGLGNITMGGAASSIPGINNVAPGVVEGGGGNDLWNSFSSWFGDTNNLKALNAGLGVAGGLWNIYQGNRQFDLAKDQFNFSKDAFNKQYETQKKLTNADLEARQRARIAANPNAGFQPVPDYMAKTGVV